MTVALRDASAFGGRAVITNETTVTNLQVAPAVAGFRYEIVRCVFSGTVAGQFLITSGNLSGPADVKWVGRIFAGSTAGATGALARNTILAVGEALVVQAPATSTWSGYIEYRLVPSA